MKPTVERILERGLFASRWLMAPFYVGLVAALIVLLYAFGSELVRAVTHLGEPEHMAETAILFALTLIDLSLAANLVLIVIFSGYENFVSKIHTGDHEDRPEWMGAVDFSALKLKLIASIVAISGIALLKAFLGLSQEGTAIDQPRVMLLIAVHLTFVVSGVLLALMDYLTSKAKKH